MFSHDFKHHLKMKDMDLEGTLLVSEYKANNNNNNDSDNGRYLISQSVEHAFGLQP